MQMSFIVSPRKFSGYKKMTHEKVHGQHELNLYLKFSSNIIF